MKKLLVKITECYAKTTVNGCPVVLFHQPKAPRKLVKK